tara:strand:- start:2006 stop:2737 length:732 start_codon:yes stop_codon:yes gene_type:complete
MENLQERKLQIKNRDEFLKYLDSLSKINESAILTIKKDKVESLVASPDNTLILYSEFASESDFEDSINIPDLKKLSRVIDTIPSNDIEFKVNSNNLEYKGNGIKFKYHLFEEGFLSKPNLNLDKINSFEFDIKFSIDKNILNQIFKGSTFASETNKIYFYTENGQLMAELTDRARHNTDNFTLTLQQANFELKPTPINFDNIRLLTNISNSFAVKINTQFGVVVFDNSLNNIKLKYIISSLTQ